ncbi:hypothetical protein [Methylocapsa aurea]|uniref:hypothetical protein n=1 Tax=Methylocapsa aurea TaxID=663610 RepID=UPI00056CB0DC
MAPFKVWLLPEKIEPEPIDATEIAAPKGHAMAVEKIENLDRDLTAIVHAIAELRRREPAIVGP